MNLQENINRINQMMGIITEDRMENVIIKMIDNLGVVNAVKMVGDYQLIKPYLKEIDKINFIKEKVNDLSEDFGGGFGLAEIDEEPIHYDESDNELRQIEYLSEDGVQVDVYDNNMDRYLGDFSVRYDNLPSDVIDELFQMLLKY